MNVQDLLYAISLFKDFGAKVSYAHLSEQNYLYSLSNHIFQFVGK